MRHASLLAVRNSREIRRDPTFTIFCLAFPALLLALLRLLAHYAEPSAAHSLQALLAATAVFAHSLIACYTAALVARDRSYAFLHRLYGRPVRSSAFFCGYLLSGIWLSFLQTFICYFTASLLSLVDRTALPLSTLFASLAAQIPSVGFFVTAGILLGALLSRRATPAIALPLPLLTVICSCIWLPPSAPSGFGSVCLWLPFAPAASVLEALFSDAAPTFAQLWRPLLICSLYFICTAALSAVLLVRFLQKKCQ